MTNSFLFGYAGAAIALLYLLVYLFRAVIQKKKVKPGLPDMALSAASLVLLLLYATLRRDWPFVIFFLTMVVWATLGFVELSKKK